MTHQTVTTVCIIVSLVTCFVPSGSFAYWPDPLVRHVFPDGYVDRTISVVVRDQVVRIEYSVGMNDVTMGSMLQEWSVLDQQTQADVEQAKEETIESVPTCNSPSASQPTPIAASDVEENFRNDETLAAQFRKLAIAKLKPGLIIKCNGQPLVFTAVSNPTRLRRHMSLTVEYECSLPELRQLNQLSIVDTNFENLAGAIRLSLKSAGTAVLTQSNVAPILVRAEAVDLNDLNSDDRKKSCTIDAKIILATKPQNARSPSKKK